MKSKLLVSTATAAILTAFVVASAQETPRGGKADSVAPIQGSPGSQGNQGEQGKGKQAQPKPAPNRNQGQQSTDQRDDNQRDPGKGKQAQPKVDQNRNPGQQNTGQGQRDESQGDQRKGKQAQPKPDQNRPPQSTGQNQPNQGQADQDKAKQAQPKTDPSGSTQNGRAATTQGRLELNVEQRTRIRQTVFARSDVPRATNINFNVSVGTVIPSRVRVVAVPPVIIELYPQYRNHVYFVVQEEIIILDNRRRIVAVIPVDAAGGSASSGGAYVAVDLSPDEIRQVQVVLLQRGYDIVVDGEFGPRTRQALILFQQRQGLQASGRIDSRTVAELGISIRSSDQPSTTGQGGDDRRQSPSDQEPSRSPQGSPMGQPDNQTAPKQRGNQMNNEPPAGTTGQGGGSQQRSPVNRGQGAGAGVPSNAQPPAKQLPNDNSPGVGTGSSTR